MSQQPLYNTYPNPVIRQPSSPHSNGSFGPVFIVLAIIVVVSGVACVLGRLCSRRSHHSKEVHHHPKADKESRLGPKEWESTRKQGLNMRDGDIEFGFDHKRMPSGYKVGNNGGGNGKSPHGHNGNGKSPHGHNGGQRPEVRFAENV
ncbi:hypothetical protein CDL12_02149 [Handroanthus impetiginosus]|uniref:Transmembrane protein n=1 Tax=Handroanthus impetiginosus TaxID=429701 RepID=A0A2G9I5S9_9LAMI|nr:hypothetical protein CDL12_02149 [Handroanthus impetiginosus]